MRSQPDDDRRGATARGHEEAELVGRLQRGEPAAFAALVARYRRPMRSLARRLLSNEASAEEAVQELWCSVVRSIHTFEWRGAFYSWLARILVNHAHTIGVREARTRAHELLLLDAPDAHVPDTALAVEPPKQDQLANHIVVQELARLSSKQRDVLLLSDVLGWSTGDVCDALSLNPINQRVLLHRARRALAAAVGDALAAGLRPAEKLSS